MIRTLRGMTVKCSDLFCLSCDLGIPNRISIRLVYFWTKEYYCASIRVLAIFGSVSRSFECEIATPAFKNRHKIATFLAQIATFASNNVEKWSSFYCHCIFMWQSFWKMWHFRRKSGILSWQNQIDGVYTRKNTKIMGFYALKKSPLEKNWSPLDPKNRHGGDKSPQLVTLIFIYF